ncbi:MAG: 3'-5' exonuclease [Acidobacteria bacterium]|nr:3'-5' exonuclease [Acidobacteriota bacterium]
MEEFAKRFLFIDFNNAHVKSVIRRFIENETIFEIIDDKIFLRKEKPLSLDIGLQDVEYAFLDTETTSLGKSSRIIEIGIVISKGENEILSYSSLFDPKIPISKETAELTGINSCITGNSPTFDEKWDEIRCVLKGKVVVAHNLSFDLGALESELNRLGESLFLDFPPICTLKLARKIFREESCSLDSLCEILGIKINERHRALPDALLAKKLFFQILIFISRNDLANLTSLADLLCFISK